MNKPTVLDTITFMTSTAFNEEFIIVGSVLHELMQIIFTDLIKNPNMFGVERIQFEAPETTYSNEFYLDVWFKSARPLTEQFIRTRFPKAWFLKFYVTKTYLA